MEGLCPFGCICLSVWDAAVTVSAEQHTHPFTAEVGFCCASCGEGFLACGKTHTPSPCGRAEGAEPQTVLGVVRQPASPEAFPGLYATSLPERPFVGGGAAVLLNSSWGNRGVIVRVDLGSGGVTLLSDAEDAPGSWALLDTDGGVPFPRKHQHGCLQPCLHCTHKYMHIKPVPAVAWACRPSVQAAQVLLICHLIWARHLAHHAPTMGRWRRAGLCMLFTAWAYCMLCL